MSRAKASEFLLPVHMQEHLIAQTKQHEREEKSEISLSAHSQEYLIAWTKPHERGKKFGKIETYGKAFKKTVFTESYQYLQGNKNEHEFANSIKTAETNFRKGALNIDRDIWRRCMKGLVNFLSHITLVGMLVNVYHKKQTGNWLLYDKTRSTAVVKEVLQTEVIDKFKEMKKQNQALKDAPPDVSFNQDGDPAPKRPGKK